MKAMSNSKRANEADEVKLSALPRQTRSELGRTKLYLIVSQASGREDDKVLSWIREVETKEAKPEYFAKLSMDFATLDRKIAASPTKLAQNELGRQTTRPSTKSAVWQEDASC